VLLTESDKNCFETLQNLTNICRSFLRE